MESFLDSLQALRCPVCPIAAHVHNLLIVQLWLDDIPQKKKPDAMSGTFSCVAAVLSAVADAGLWPPSHSVGTEELGIPAAVSDSKKCCVVVLIRLWWHRTVRHPC